MNADQLQDGSSVKRHTGLYEQSITVSSSKYYYVTVSPALTLIDVIHTTQQTC